MDRVTGPAKKIAARKRTAPPVAPAPAKKKVAFRGRKGGVLASFREAHGTPNVGLAIELYREGLNARIERLQSGVPASWVLSVAKSMGASTEALSSALDIPRSTLDKHVAKGLPLRKEHGERMLGLMALIGQVETMIDESGDAEGFDAAAWVKQWISEPNPALGGRRPEEYLDTVTGQSLISDLLAKMQSGAYA